MASLTLYGFPWGSVGGDRTYNETDFQDYFNNLFIDGVVPNKLNEMVVTESDTPAKSVKVDTGFVIIQGVQYGIETAETLSISDNASGDDRIDRVVARLDYTNRTAELDVLQGTPSATPTAPALTQTSTIYEISLSTVSVANGFTTITNSDITADRSFAKVNVIFDADFLNSESPSYYLARENHTGTQLASTISNFASTVRATVLTGLSTATNAVISATDSILTALGKLQKQITTNKNKLDGIESGAEVNDVNSVDGRTGTVSLSDRYEPKNTNIQSHISNTNNPHSVNKSDVGLGSVENYSPVILQAKYSQLTTDITKEGDVYQNVFSLSITPKKSTSMIELDFSGEFQHEQSGTFASFYLAIREGATIIAEGYAYERSEDHFVTYSDTMSLKKVIPSNSTATRTFSISVKSTDTDGWVAAKGTQHACLMAKEING